MAKSISVKRRKQIARSARKAAKKQKSKHGKTPKKLKIQTAATWKRIVIAIFSLLFLGLSIYLKDISLFGCIASGLLFVFTLGTAIIGNKKIIDSGINGIDASISDRALDSIIDGLF